MSTPRPAASRQAPQGGQANSGAAHRSLESTPTHIDNQSPTARLEASRAALHAWLIENKRQHPNTAPKHEAPTGEDPSWLTAFFESLADVPAATIAAHWLRRWWAKHPWRDVVDLATAVATEVVAPVAKRHPWWLLGGAVLAGAALTRVRPWRWISGGALLTSLLPTVSVSAVLKWVTEALSAMAPAAENQTPPDAQSSSSSAPVAAEPAPPTSAEQPP